MDSKMTPQEIEQAHKEASALHTALTGFDDNGQPATASEDTAPTGAFKQGDRVLWIPHNHTGYISEVDERDGLPCYYLELDNTDETGYAKHESLKLVGEDCRIYPKEQSEVEKLQTELASLRAQVEALAKKVKHLKQQLDLESGFVEFLQKGDDHD